MPYQQRLSVLVVGATPIFLLRDIGSVTILRTIFATEPALLNRLCFIGYLCSVFHIIDAYSAKIDMSMPALWREFDAFCRSYVTLVRSSAFSDYWCQPKIDRFLYSRFKMPLLDDVKQTRAMHLTRPAPISTVTIEV